MSLFLGVVGYGKPHPVATLEVVGSGKIAKPLQKEVYYRSNCRHQDSA